ncbi:MAG: hypothetical protein JWQ77_789, partial [Jatrophihabitans sp.]|nr:hypothetical protein [Jatrophihabitans sp.]
GLCAFWVGATVLEALYFAPVVLRVVRSPKQAPRRLATSQLVSA